MMLQREREMASTYAKALARAAEREFDVYGRFDETHPTMQQRIRRYWEDIDLNFDTVVVPWSAVFVSYQVKTAGATAGEFKFAAAHSQFVFVAARNAANGTGVFRAYPVTDYAPKVGDIIQNNRGSVSYTFQYAKTHKSYPSHSAIVVEEGLDGSGRYVRTIGGNEGNKVGQRIVRLDARGFIKPPASAPKYYISVVQNLK
jgi:hypothetical protein